MRPTKAALDKNFPEPILKCIAPYIPEIEFIPIGSLDRTLETLIDWKLIVAISHLDIPILVTNDRRMLSERRVVMAASQTRTTLVVVESLGHDPVRASGALLLDLPLIAKKLLPHKSKIYESRRGNPTPQKPLDYLKKRAKRLGKPARQLIREERLSKADLEDPLPP